MLQAERTMYVGQLYEGLVLRHMSQGVSSLTSQSQHICPRTL